ncbi:MAG: hypothetical protein HeimC2_35480, partial [Candidatus Heimdallarchaeota archaeon LC_2]
GWYSFTILYEGFDQSDLETTLSYTSTVVLTQTLTQEEESLPDTGIIEFWVFIVIGVILIVGLAKFLAKSHSYDKFPIEEDYTKNIDEAMNKSKSSFTPNLQYCGNCGSNLDVADLFCSDCGIKI